MPANLFLSNNWTDACQTTRFISKLKLSNRDRLISEMLQGREVLRLLSAPHGYGKSALAYEYASRLFAEADVMWLDAASSEFLSGLDAGGVIAGLKQDDDLPKLLIVDDIPYLDEFRSSTLHNLIDSLICQGVEVVATTIPTHDCLRSIPDERILIDAVQLQVAEKECKSLAPNAGSNEDAVTRWRNARKQPLGCVPAVFWGDAKQAQAECLEGFFAERLPVSIIKAAFAMCLMAEGGMDDLSSLGVDLMSEDEIMLCNDYPFLGINSIQRTFDTGQIRINVLAQAIASSQFVEQLTQGVFPLNEKVMGLLIERGSCERASKILDEFCSDQRCVVWLENSGWILLDQGEIMLLERLLKRVMTTGAHMDAKIYALHAWTSGLLGDLQEAVYYARRAARSKPVIDGVREETAFEEMMGYLAMLAFDPATEVLSRAAYGADYITEPRDFLAAVVDLCTENELKRALVLHPSEASRSLESERTDATDERAATFEALFSRYAEAFGESLPFRLSLHFLQFVDHLKVRSVLCDFGMGAVISMRSRGVRGLVDTMLISDLWRNGLFGISTRSADVRDARLMGSAATRISKLNTLAPRLEPIPTPWETGERPDGALEEAGKKKSGKVKVEERIPNLNVRLFGAIEVTVGERFIPEKSWRRKALLLFCLLVVNQGKDVPRETLFEQLWPGADYAHALDSYYNVWSNANRLLGNDNYIQRSGEYCRVNARYVSSDVAEFEQLTRRLLVGRDDPAALLDVYSRLELIYRGGLMPSERKNKAIQSYRQYYESVFVDSMVAAAHKAVDVKDARVGLWFARKAMDIDPRREDVYHAMLEAQIAAGQRCSAVDTYFKCQRFLRDEMGLDPGEDIQRLYQELILSDPSLVKLEPTLARR